MGVDSICLREAAHLLSRSLKYSGIVAKMYYEGLNSPNEARLFRAAYFFCRHIDDVLDGDRKITGSPETYVNEIIQAIKQGKRGPEITELFRFAIGPIKNKARSSENPVIYFEQVIQAMLFDYHRAKERRVLWDREIDEYYQDILAPVLNISLIIAGSEVRAENMPELYLAQGHIYSVRDLRKDWKNGIINIPKEVLDVSGLDASAPFKEIAADSSIRAWMDSEIRTYGANLPLVKAKLSDESSKKLFMPLINGMAMYCRFYNCIK